MKKPRPSSKTIMLYVARSGPKVGEPECQAAFKQKDDAVQFLTDLHGLKPEEAKLLKRQLKLPLKKRIHGSEACQIAAEEMPSPLARKALSGELYLTEAPNIRTPRKLRATKPRIKIAKK